MLPPAGPGPCRRAEPGHRDPRVARQPARQQGPRAADHARRHHRRGVRRRADGARQRRERGDHRPGREHRHEPHLHHAERAQPQHAAAGPGNDAGHDAADADGGRCQGDRGARPAAERHCLALQRQRRDRRARREHDRPDHRHERGLLRPERSAQPRRERSSRTPRIAPASRSSCWAPTWRRTCSATARRSARRVRVKDRCCG